MPRNNYYTAHLTKYAAETLLDDEREEFLEFVDALFKDQPHEEAYYADYGWKKLIDRWRIEKQIA